MKTSRGSKNFFRGLKNPQTFLLKIRKFLNLNLRTAKLHIGSKEREVLEGSGYDPTLHHDLTEAGSVNRDEVLETKIYKLSSLKLR